MGVYEDGHAATLGVYGNLVRSLGKLVVTNSTNSLFTVATGPVVLTSLVGIVSVAIPNTASLTAKLVYTPTGGSVADLTAATAITNDAIGTHYTLPVTALVTDDMSELSAAVGVPDVTYGLNSHIDKVLRPGVLGLTVSNHTSTPGAVDWYLTYLPLGAGAVVTAN